MEEMEPTRMSKTAPEIIIDDPAYTGSAKLTGKVAIITGGDSGIGAATAVAFAKEGANIVINYLYEDKDAQHVQRVVELCGSHCVLVKGDLGEPGTSQDIVKQAVDAFGAINILVNNAGTQVQQASLLDITAEQLDDTFRTNMYSMFHLTQEVLPHLAAGDSIINTTSVTAYRGHDELVDYAATKGAILAFTRSLSAQLASKQIRVNAVAPGPIWSPLVLTSFDQEKLKNFGKQQPLGRAGQPVEVAPAYVYLASADASYVSGQVIHVNGGEIVGG